MRSNNLVTHITRVHKVSIIDYKARFPGCEVIRLTSAQLDKAKATRTAKDSKHKCYKAEQNKNKLEAIAAGMQILQCRLCDKQSVLSLIGHITRKHNITIDEYRASYPDDILQQNSPAHARKCSKSLKARLEDPENKAKFMEWRSFPSEIKHWTKKGFTQEEAEQKVIEFQRMQSLKGNNDVTRAKRSKKSSGDNNPMSIESIAKREGVSVSEARKLTPCYGRTGESHPMFGQKHSEEALTKIANAEHLRNPDYRSIAERELETLCRELLNSDLEHNAQIQRWNVDIVFNNKKFVVEYFGDFWHMNPQKYVAGDVHYFIKRTAQQIWDRDSRKLNELRELGYHVEVIWESDWRHDKHACMQRIKDAYDRTL